MEPVGGLYQWFWTLAAVVLGGIEGQLMKISSYQTMIDSMSEEAV